MKRFALFVVRFDVELAIAALPSSRATFSRVSAGLRNRPPSWRIAVFGMGMFALAMAPGAALGQVMCNSSLTPTPPPAVHFNVSNQSFGNTAPLEPFVQFTLGMDGCKGADGNGIDVSGADGSPGQPGGRPIFQEIPKNFAGGRRFARFYASPRARFR